MRELEVGATDTAGVEEAMPRDPMEAPPPVPAEPVPRVPPDDEDCPCARAGKVKSSAASTAKANFTVVFI